MTKITYLERSRENDPFHSAFGVAEYLSKSMKSHFVPSEENRNQAIELEETPVDERDDCIAELLSKNSSGDLAFNPKLVYNLNHSEAHSRSNDEEERDAPIGKTHEDSGTAPSNTAPKVVYTGMSKRLQDLLQEDDDDEDVGQNNSSGIYSKKEQNSGRDPPPSSFTPSKAMHSNNSFSGSTPTNRWQKCNPSAELATIFECQPRVLSSTEKRSPTKYSVSKIHQATSGPVPKADDFFDELKKWHKNYALRDVEKPRQITIRASVPSVTDEAEEDVGFEIEEIDAIDHLDTTKPNKKSKGKKWFWGRKERKADNEIFDDNDKDNEHAIEVTISKSVDKRVHKKELKAKKAEMKKAAAHTKKVKKDDEKSTSETKEDVVANDVANTEAKADPSKLGEEIVTSDKIDSVNTEETAKKKKKSWFLKIPIISKKKIKSTKSEEIARNSVGVNTEDPKEEPADYPTLGIAENPTKKPIKGPNVPSFEVNLKKFLKLEAGIYDEQSTADSATDDMSSSGDVKAKETSDEKNIEENEDTVAMDTAQSYRCVVTDADADCRTQMNALMQQIISASTSRLNALESVDADALDNNSREPDDSSNTKEKESAVEEYVPVCPCPSGDLLDYVDSKGGNEPDSTKELKQSESWLDKASKIFQNLTQTETTTETATETAKLEVTVEENDFGIEVKVEGNESNPGSSWDAVEPAEEKEYTEPLKFALDQHDSATEKTHNCSTNLTLPLVKKNSSLLDLDNSEASLADTESLSVKSQSKSEVPSTSMNTSLLNDQLIMAARSNSMATEANPENIDDTPLATDDLSTKSQSSDSEHNAQKCPEDEVSAKLTSEQASSGSVAVLTAADDNHLKESPSCDDSKSSVVEPAEQDATQNSRVSSIAAGDSGSVCVSMTPSKSESCTDSKSRANNQGSVRTESMAGLVVLGNQSKSQDVIEKTDSNADKREEKVENLFGKARSQNAKKEQKRNTAMSTTSMLGKPEDAPNDERESTKATTLFEISPSTTKAVKNKAIKTKNNKKHSKKHSKKHGAQAATLFGKQQESDSIRAKRKKRNEEQSKLAPTLF
eukprot:jgi/Psemu1/69040/estExt_Genemark1.C_6830010